MRPRLFTAENVPPDACNADAFIASMRPRLFTAENRLLPRDDDGVPYVLQ